jgi:hypothetical protein
MRENLGLYPGRYAISPDNIRNNIFMINGRLMSPSKTLAPMERVLTFGVERWNRLTPMLLVMQLAARMEEVARAAAVVDLNTTIVAEATLFPLTIVLVLGPVDAVAFAGVLANLVESLIPTNRLGDLI